MYPTTPTPWHGHGHEDKKEGLCSENLATNKYLIFLFALSPLDLWTNQFISQDLFLDYFPPLPFLLLVPCFPWDRVWRSRRVITLYVNNQLDSAPSSLSPIPDKWSTSCSLPTHSPFRTAPLCQLQWLWSTEDLALGIMDPYTCPIGCSVLSNLYHTSMVNSWGYENHWKARLFWSQFTKQFRECVPPILARVISYKTLI